MNNLFITAFILLSINLSSQDITIPDANFLNALISLGIDANGDGVIQVSEAESQTTLDVSRESIADLTGIEFFVNLENLNANRNRITELDLGQLTALRTLILWTNQLSSLDLSQLTALEKVDLKNNQLTSIDLSQLVKLENIDLDLNMLTQLDISNNVNLVTLLCNDNSIASLDISNNILLDFLECQSNDLTELDLNGMFPLTTLNCSGNSISALDLSGLSLLQYFSCSNNTLEEIDVSTNLELVTLDIDFNSIMELDISNNLKLFRLNCSNNQISELDASNNEILYSVYCGFNNIELLDFSNNPGLGYVNFPATVRYLNIHNGGYVDDGFQVEDGQSQLEVICIDDFEYDEVVRFLGQSTFDIQNISILENCVFPSNFGNLSNRVVGQVYLDQDGDCDPSDQTLQQVGFNISTASGSEYEIPYQDRSMGFDIPLPSEPVTITPFIENSALFIIEPETLELELMSGDTIVSDFCVRPGPNPLTDLNVDISPIDRAQAGFEAEYKLIYSNQGNDFSNGTVSVSFDHNLMTYVTSVPEMELVSDGVLNYNYEDLLPLSSDEVSVTFRFNSPMDSPPLEGGELLELCAEIIPIETNLLDDPEGDKIQILVVNALDPNDKTCLQGEYQLDEMLGEYLTYQIRFENIGTAPARNILVEDRIDRNIFDISSLKVVDASHDHKTVIEEDIVSFVFESIDLPFQDDLNDGFVTFKLKTWDSLELGDSIQNEANIYFDFNFPILTNKTSTIVVTDADGDGFHSEEDCNDSNAGIFPGAEDIPGNGIDEDCDGVDAPSGVHELAGVTISVFPMPASQYINIRLEGVLDLDITLMDMKGREILKSSNTQIIEVSHISAGTYLLEMKDRVSGQRVVEKIIIN